MLGINNVNLELASPTFSIQLRKISTDELFSSATEFLYRQFCLYERTYDHFKSSIQQVYGNKQVIVVYGKGVMGIDYDVMRMDRRFFFIYETRNAFILTYVNRSVNGARQAKRRIFNYMRFPIYHLA